MFPGANIEIADWPRFFPMKPGEAKIEFEQHNDLYWQVKFLDMQYPYTLGLPQGDADARLVILTEIFIIEQQIAQHFV